MHPGKIIPHILHFCYNIFGFEYVKNPLPWQIDDERMRLSKVVIGEGVTDIGYSCYRLWYLEEVSIPDSVTSISNYAFYGCVSLKEISITPQIKR